MIIHENGNVKGTFLVGDNEIRIEKMDSKITPNDLTEREKIVRKYWKGIEASLENEAIGQRNLVVRKPSEPKEEKKSKTSDALSLMFWPFRIHTYFGIGYVVVMCMGLFGGFLSMGLVLLALLLIPAIVMKWFGSGAKVKKRNLEAKKKYEEDMRKYELTLKENEKKKLQSQARIEDIIAKLAEKVRPEVDQYDAQVELYAKKALDNAAGIEEMVSYTFDKFRNRISGQRTSSDVRFIEASLAFQVTSTRITYVYESGYSSYVSDFVFKDRRYHDLNNEFECEGLARAIATLVVVRQKAQTPMAMITMDHMDSKYTVRYKVANSNFKTAKDIF